MRNSKKIISVLLAVVLAFSCITTVTSFTASAAGDKFNVNVTSNFFPERTETFDATTERITVSYYIKSDKMMVNSQWNLTFDPEVLQYCTEDGVNQTAIYWTDDETGETEFMGNEYNISPVAETYGAVINTEKVNIGEIHGNNSNANPVYTLKDGDSKVCFITVTFDVLDPTKDTTVDLEFVEFLTNEGQIIKFSTVQDESYYDSYEFQSSVYEGNFDPDYENQEPATEEPTTVEPTTEEPTEEPTTEEPTEEPTTEEPAPAATYTVAGSAVDIFNGAFWEASAAVNDMTFNDQTGLYEITYTNVAPADSIQFKVVKDHSWDVSYPEDNYTFNVTEACDITVTFDPETNEVNVIGDGVTQDTELIVTSVIAGGNGEDTYLNGANWDASDVSNALTEVADGVWEMTMEDIYAFDNYQIKFAVNSIDEDGNPTSNAWAHNFGSEIEQIYPTGEPINAVYNGNNCIFEVEENGSTVKLQLDLREFDFATKQGAKFTITVTPPEEEPTTEEPTTEPAVISEGIIGDVNMDGVVTVADATAIQRYAIELDPECDFNNKLADVNNDGVINVLDASCVQRFAAQMTKKIGNAGKNYEDIVPASDNPQILK